MYLELPLNVKIDLRSRVNEFSGTTFFYNDEIRVICGLTQKDLIDTVIIDFYLLGVRITSESKKLLELATKLKIGELEVRHFIPLVLHEVNTQIEIGYTKLLEIAANAYKTGKEDGIFEHKAKIRELMNEN